MVLGQCRRHKGGGGAKIFFLDKIGVDESEGED